MAQLKQGSAGTTTRELDASTPVRQEPSGVPAGVIGTANRGRAFVPVTVGSKDDFDLLFGASDGKKFGPLAVYEWLKNAGAATYFRVLGVGDGLKRSADGSVTSAGFTVGEDQPDPDNDGQLTKNSYANDGVGSVAGRTYFLGCFMSETLGSSFLSDAGLQTSADAVPVIRGVLMTASGVIAKLSSSAEGTNAAPASTLVATEANHNGMLVGAVKLLENGVAKSDFVLLLNGHKGTNPSYPNVVTASFDMTSPNYFYNVLNRDPLKYNEAGHYLYASWDIHPSVATVTGSGLVSPLSGAGASTAKALGLEQSAFITTSSLLARNTGTSYVPNYEAFTDRFSYASSPWVISQKFGGAATKLFKFHALDAGAGVSTNYKISIENLTPSSDALNKYGTFDVVLRDWSDTDETQVILEQFRGLSLDPSSDRYIAKIIGDVNVYFDFDRTESAQKLEYDGNYENISKLVRVEVSTDVDTQTVDPTALPVGFSGIGHLVTSGSSPLASHGGTELTAATYLKRSTTPPLPLRLNITNGSGVKVQVNPRLYWGAQFEHVTNLSTPNVSSIQNKSLQAFAKYFPDFSLTNQNFFVSDNSGEVDTAQNGILDVDRFCNNKFTLENLQVVTGSDGKANSSAWVSAEYVRDGNIVASDANKTRAFKVDDLVQANRRFAKFTFFMQGGFDGTNIFDYEEANLTNVAVSNDMNATNRGRNNGATIKAYLKALEVMKNTTNVDIQVLAVPGIRHPFFTDAASEAVKERFDAVYVMDLEQLDNTGAEVTADSQMPSVTNTVNEFINRSIDNDFVAAYFPDVLMTDPTTNTNLFVPPSVQVLGALALNDAVGHPWFAPAGYTRGALSSGLEARVFLNKRNMDALYDANINPIVAFPGNATSGTNPKGGLLVWGQKTLKASASALDRLNVRRLLVDIRRQVRDVARTVQFEPSRESTLADFTDKVTPKLQRVQALGGVEKFKIVIDASTTTQADIENNTLRGKIFVKPVKSIEYVSLDFVVSNNIEEA